MAKACCVCGDSADKQDNLLFTCKGHGCDVVVHQGTLYRLENMLMKRGDFERTLSPGVSFCGSTKAFKALFVHLKGLKRL